MATLHVMQGTWYSNGVAVTVNGDTCAQTGQPPQQLIPVDRTLAGKKVITVARTLNGEEIIVDPSCHDVIAYCVAEPAWRARAHLDAWLVPPLLPP